MTGRDDDGVPFEVYVAGSEDDPARAQQIWVAAVNLADALGYEAAGELSPEVSRWLARLMSAMQATAEARMEILEQVPAGAQSVDELPEHLRWLGGQFGLDADGGGDDRR